MNDSLHRPPTSGSGPADPPASRAGRKAYRSPTILSRERLELIAAVCSPPGKGDPGACPTGPISS